MGAGRHKLLLPLDERPVLTHVIEATLKSQAHPIIIVLGHQADQVRIHIAPYITDPNITLIENTHYLQGMSTSMRVGLQVLIDNGYKNNIDSALILLGDQPLVTPQLIDALIAARQTSEKRIIVPLYDGKRGNPILFAASLFPELLEVTGDEGGRSVIERHRQNMTTIELGNAMTNYDVDTWEGYQQVVEAWQRKKIQ